MYSVISAFFSTIYDSKWKAFVSAHKGPSVGAHAYAYRTAKLAANTAAISTSLPFAVCGTVIVTVSISEYSSFATTNGISVVKTDTNPN